MNTIDKRFLLAGALAGASSIAVLALATVALLGVGLMWQYMFSSSIPVIRDTALGAMLADAGRIPSFLWSWRWPLLATTVVGIVLAFGERLVQRLPFAWRESVVGAVLLGVLGAVAASGLLLTADQPLYDLGNRTGQLPDLASRQQAAWNLLLLAALLALAVAGVIWLLWAWWYRHWRHWLGLGAATYSEPATRPAEEWFALRQVQTRFRRRTTLLAGIGAALTLAGVLGFGATRATVRSGDVWARPELPNVAVPLTLTNAARQLAVENTFGNGEVDVQLLRAADQAPVAGPVTLRFTADQLGVERQTLDVAALPAGDYLLNAQLRAGQGGRAGYALLERQAALVPLMAIVAALGLGTLLGGALLLLASRRAGGGGEE